MLMNSAWNADACVLIAWNSWPKFPNNCAIAADTSSAAAAATPLVGPAAAEAASANDVRIPAKFCAAALIKSG
jgi:hypothetical protein